MKEMLDVKMLGFGNRVKVLVAALLCVVCAMMWVFAHVGKQAGRDQVRLADTAEQLVLSQRIAKYALAAATGDTAAFREMKSSSERFSSLLQAQVSDPDMGAGIPDESITRALADLDNHWTGFRSSIDELLDGEILIISLAEAASVMNQIMPQLMEHTQGVVDILVEKGASARQVSLASRQAVLAQRIVNSISRIMTGEGVESAAVVFAEDTREFGKILDGFMRGTGGITALQGGGVKAKVQKIAMLFNRISDHVGSIAENSEELMSIQAAAKEISSRSETLFTSVDALKTLIEDASDRRIVNTQLAYYMGAAGLFFLLWIGFEMLRSQKQRNRVVEEENSRTQDVIMRLINEMGDLADGDLTVHTTVDEGFTGAIADSINVTVDSLRGLVRTINDTSTQLSASMQETEVIASQLNTASEQQSRDISGAVEAINQMSSSMEEVSTNADESSKVAMSAVEIARKGGQAVHRTVEGMDTIREHIQGTSKRIKRLGESSQEIGDIVELINDIAEQTNILALNASIQAAMAGEAGRGFAVVADEVQRLAERSANATRQIETLVKTIQADTHEAVISMEKSTAGVVKGAEVTEAAGDALEEIERVSNQLAELIMNISSSSRQQASSAAAISTSMNGIQEITDQAVSGTKQTSLSIGNLARLAHDLDKSVAGFKLP